MNDDVRVEDVGLGVTVVTLDRPPANSLDLAARHRIRQLWDQLREDGDVRAIVVTGAGDRFFSAGLDLDELEVWHNELTPEERRNRIDLLRWSAYDAGLLKPIVAAINGYCLAGGMYLAAMCDVRISSHTAEFGIPEARWNLPAVFAWQLTRQMPLALLMEMTLWADRRFSADRMYTAGFVNHVVATEDVVPTAVEWAAQAAALPSEAVAAHKKMLLSSAYPERERTQSEAEYLLGHLHDDPAGGDLLRSFVTRPGRE